MKAKFITFIFGIILFHQSQAQDGFFKTSNYDVSAAVGEGQYAGLLSFSHMYGIAFNKKLKIGFGARAFYYGGTEKEYLTAPASITKNAYDIDTFTVKSPGTVSLNLALHIMYSMEKFDVGFNIDVFGGTLGGEKEGYFNSGNDTKLMDKVNPSPMNLLLIGDNDRGSLASEFYVRYWISDKIGVRAGFNFLFSEYTTNGKYPVDSDKNTTYDRWRNKALLGFVGITYCPSR